MTGNKVELYKVPWAYGGIRQPYFLSDTSRSSFFNGLTNSLVVADNGVNIKLDFNFEIETVVNADITAVQDYNFGIITYNNHKYYADIIDIEMVNVGRTRISFKRNVTIEHTNFLSNFKNFNISKCYFNDFSYSPSTKYFLKEDYRKTINFEDFTLHYKMSGCDTPDIVKFSNSTSYDNLPVTDIKFAPFVILYLTQLTSETSGYPSYQYYNSERNYFCLLIPLEELKGGVDTFIIEP